MNATAAAPKQSQNPLIDYIVENLDLIKNGGAVFQGERITLDTELVRYHTCFSFIVFFMRQSSPYFIKGTPEATKAASIAIVASSLLGWWSIHGIIFTPITLVRNILHSDKTTIGQLIEKAENPPKKLHPALRVLAVLCLLLLFGFFIWVGMIAQGRSH